MFTTDAQQMEYERLCDRAENAVHQCRQCELLGDAEGAANWRQVANTEYAMADDLDRFGE